MLEPSAKGLLGVFATSSQENLDCRCVLLLCEFFAFLQIWVMKSGGASKIIAGGLCLFLET